MKPEGRWVILVTDPLATDGLAVLSQESRFDVRVNTEAAGDALHKEVGDAHALLVRSGTEVTAGWTTSTWPRLRAEVSWS